MAVADPNPVEKAEKNSLEILLDVFIGGSKAIYHFTEDFVLGVVEMIEDPVAALEALATMVFNPIDTGYYLGKMIFESFVRDVIHGDAESRAHWFTYALSTVLGPKAVKQVGKKVDSKAKAVAQKAEQQLDDLLPYHPKHQVALVGPVPYHVFNGGFFVDRLIVMVERLPGSLNGVNACGRGVGRGMGNKADKVKDCVIRDGSHMRANGALKSDVKYKAGEYECFYETDNVGRLQECNADNLKSTERDGRLPDKSNRPGKEIGDHAGHLAGDRFRGISSFR